MMKTAGLILTSRRTRLNWICVLLAASFAVQGGSLPADDQSTLKFRKLPLMISPNEGCAVGDVNMDGRLDVVAGPAWFAAPDFVPRRLRNIDDMLGDFLRNNGDHLYDVNGDGWLDVISGEWLGSDIHWYENPGEKGLQKGLLWKPHLLKQTRGENEAFFIRDLDGDGSPEIVVDCWEDTAPLVAWKLVNSEKGEPTLERVVLGSQGCGHGMGFGDVNADGREDILTKVGWYECPKDNPLSTEWRLHKDWDRPHGSCPFLVVDLTGDGRGGLIWGDGHNYGLFWIEQLGAKAGGGFDWREHLIDRSYSQTHCLHWADLDGDGAGELITGNRVRGHSGKDPGGREPECLYYYEWNSASRQFTRHTISENEGIGTGMQIRTADLNGDGRLDIAVAGKTGTWILFNEGR